MCFHLPASIKCWSQNLYSDEIFLLQPDVSTSNGEEVADENWTYWMCLTCAHIGCGRGQHKHALAHFDTPRTDVHHLVVDIETWIVWCYTCDQKMAMNSTKKLQECVEYIRRNIQSSSKSMSEFITCICFFCFKTAHFNIFIALFFSCCSRKHGPESILIDGVCSFFNREG